MKKGPRPEAKRRVPWAFIAILLAVLIGFIFLRGPYGLISIMKRRQQVRRTEQELGRLGAEVDSLKRVHKLLEDEGSARDYARRCFEAGDSVRSPDSIR